MSGERRRRQFDGIPYHVAKNGDKEAWAYNETSKSILLLVQNKHGDSRLVNRILIRKDTLRRLAKLR